ncbi:MAG: hypothetical protein ACK45B_13040 [Limisphaerales bacterium]
MNQARHSRCNRTARRLLGPAWRCLLGLVWGCKLSTALAGAPASDAGWGPLFAEFPLTLQLGERTEALGPFYYHQSIGSERLRAVPPLFSRFDDDELDRHELDMLYPVLTYDRFGTEHRWQLLQWLSFAGGDTQDGERRRRFTLFPFYWQQRSTEPSNNYTALWPIAGQLKNRLLRDEISFTLWPVYVRTYRERGHIETINILAPIFHRRTGDGLKGWQAWPLIGSETKVPTWRTNIWDEAELVPGHSRNFFAWPFWLSETRGVGTTNQAHFRAMLPLLVWLRSPARDSTTYLWPCGLTLTESRNPPYEETQFLWPVFAWARGEGKHTTRFWPLAGESRTPTREKNFFLWPVFRESATRTETLERERTTILLFLYSDLREERKTTGQSRRRTALWPLFTHSRDLAGNERLQFLAPLEPLIPENKGVERNWSPLWSVWRSEQNATNGARSQSLLWNLYRRDVRPERRKTSALFGLFQHERTPAGTGLRVLFLPLKQPPRASAVAPEPVVPQP